LFNAFFEEFTRQEQGGVKMVHKDLVLHKTKTLLCEFLNPVIANLDKPRRKFLRQTIAAILLSGCLAVKELTRWIHDDCSDLFYRLKRLLNHLVSPSGDLSAAVAGYREMMAQYIATHMPIVIDIEAIAEQDGSEPSIPLGHRIFRTDSKGSKSF
jgi:hypothetical protein